MVSEILGLKKDDISNPNLIKLLRLLQSLDDDNDVSNGINISNEIKSKITEDKNLKDLNISEVKKLVEESGKTFVSEADALKHYKQTLKNLSIITIPSAKLINSNIENNATNVLLNKTIILSFDKNIDISKASISLKDISSEVSITKKALDKKLIITPTNLKYDTNYTLSIKGLKDIDGENISDINLKFKTIKKFGFVNSNPKNNATNIARDTSISLNFNKDINSNIKTISFKQGTKDIEFTETKNKTALILKPKKALKGDLTYKIKVTLKDNTSINISFKTIKGVSFTDTTKTVDVVENQTSALSLKANGTNITYAISGADSNEFNINDKTGLVTFKSAPDFESGKTTYTFRATASDGIDSATQDITIIITNDSSDDLQPPVLSDTTLTNVYSLNPIGTIIGKVNITSGADTITSFTLSGTNKDDFSIDTNGDVKIAKTLDFTTKPVYNLKVKATNSDGSDEVDLKIKLIDKPILSAFVQDSKNSNAISLSSSNSNQVTISSDKQKVYSAESWNGLKIYDISDITNPKVLNTSRTVRAGYFKLSSDENFIFIIFAKKLFIYDISDKTNPSEIGSLGFSSNLGSIELNEDRNVLYIKDSAKHLYTVDISSKSSPSVLDTQTLTYSYNTFSLKLYKDKLYVRDGHLYSFDIASDGKPSNKQSLSANGSKLEIKDDKIFSGIKIFGIYDISTNTTLSSLDLKEQIETIKVSGTKAYVATKTKFYTIDISDMSNPSIKDTKDVSSLKNFDMINDSSFILATGTGVKAQLNSLISTPFISDKLDVAFTSSLEFTRDIKLNKDSTKAFVGLSDSFSIVDLTNFTKERTFLGKSKYIAISKDEKLAFSSAGELRDKINILDISSSSINIKAQISGLSKPGDIALSHNQKYLYVVVNGAIFIYDISNPSSPLKKAEILAPTYHKKPILTSDDKTLFIGKRIYDVSNLTDIKRLADVSSGYGNNAKAISNDEKYLFTTGAIYDISDIKNPKKLSSLSVKGNIEAILTSEDDNIIYINGNNSILYTFDISDKSNPKLISSINAFILAIDGKTAYGANNSTFLKLDLNLATLYKRKNFGSSEIKLIISDNLGKDISLSVSDDGAGIVNIGAYPATITQSNYQGKIVSIPISSIKDKTGTTIISISLDDGVNTLTKKVYLNII